MPFLSFQEGWIPLGQRQVIFYFNLIVIIILKGRIIFYFPGLWLWLIYGHFECFPPIQGDGIYEWFGIDEGDEGWLNEIYQLLNCIHIYII